MPREFLRRYHLWRAVLLVLVVLGMVTFASAQAVGTGSITGHVTDEKGLAVVDAKVTVRNVDTNMTRDLTTDTQGDYRADLLQPGNYEVTVQAQGFATFKRGGIRLEVGSIPVVDIQLRVAAVTEVITVTEAAPITEPEKVEVSSTVTQKQIEDLPLNGRRWDNFVLLTPGVGMDGTFGLISYRGISGLLNNNTLDGADNNQAFFSEARGRTRTSNTYSQAAVKEFQVGLSNFSAEFGRAAGGTVNAVTKSGTNAWHGEVFYYIRDDALQAREPTLLDNFDNPLKNKDRRQQYGLSLGAPIIKDKVFFFGNFDQQHRTETYLVRSIGDFVSAFNSACLSGQTSPPAQLVTNCNALLDFQLAESGQQPRKRINNVALGKLDLVISPNHTLTGSYNWHRWKSPNGIQTGQVISRGLSDNGRDIVKTDSAIVRLTSVLSPRVVNQAQFQYGRDFESQDANSTEPRTTVTNGISFGMSEFLPRPAWPDEKRFQWTDTLSWNMGRHNFKAGGDINYVRDESINLFNGGGVYAYSGSLAIQSLAQDCPTPTRANGCVPFSLSGTIPVGKHWTSYNQAFDSRGLTPPGALFFTTTDWNFFFQDTFKVRPDVTINAGLRYEFQRMPEVTPVTVGGNPVLGFPGQPFTPETQSINQDANNFGPRLAIAWDVGGKQKNVFRAGAGVYYGRTPNAVIRSHLLENGVALPSFSLSGTSSTQRAAGPVYPAVLSAPAAAAVAGARSVVFMASDYVRPFIFMVEAAYEREIVRNVGFSATYVYTRGTHLTHTNDINLNASTATVNFFLDDGTFLGGKPFYAGQRPFCDTLVGPVAADCTRLGSVLRVTSELNSIYHGAIFQLNWRGRYGLTSVMHYTLSRARDDGQAQGAAPFAGRFEDFYDPRNRLAEFALSEFDTRHRFVWNYIWEPSRVWQIDNAGLRAVFGDWAISGVTTLQAGQPFTPTISGFLSGQANSSGATPCPSSGTCASATGSSNGSGGSLRPGWLPRSYILTTPFINFDLRLQKDIRITESKRIRFLWEAFNIFNRINHPNRFNFAGTGFRVVSSKTCAAGSTSPTCTGVNPSNLTLPRFVTVRLDTNYQSIIDPLIGGGNTAACTVRGDTGACLSSASGVFFGARDMQFGVKFIF